MMDFDVTSGWAAAWCLFFIGLFWLMIGGMIYSDIKSHDRTRAKKLQFFLPPALLMAPVIARLFLVALMG